MKRLFAVLLAGVFLLSACNERSAGSVPQSTTTIDTAVSDSALHNIGVGKSFYMSGDLFTTITDEATGRKITARQSLYPFCFDDSEQSTTYAYTVTIESGYALEGEIVAFMMLDGTLMESTHNGETGYLHRLPYQSGERMTAAFSFLPTSIGKAGEISFCTFLSDSVLTENYETFVLAKESISAVTVPYSMADVSLPPINITTALCSDYRDYNAVREQKEDEPEDNLPFTQFSCTEQYGESSDRFLLEPQDNLFLLSSMESGRYRGFVLLDDMPIAAFDCKQYLDLQFSDDIVAVVPLELSCIPADDALHTIKFVCTDLETGICEIRCSQLVKRGGI